MSDLDRSILQSEKEHFTQRSKISLDKPISFQIVRQRFQMGVPFGLQVFFALTLKLLTMIATDCLGASQIVICTLSAPLWLLLPFGLQPSDDGLLSFCPRQKP